MKIAEIGKAEGRWCGDCAPGKGCRVHKTRPGECARFFCGWLTNPDLGDDWFPARAKLVVTLEGDGRMVAVHVDPAAPRAWREEPYFAKIESWARMAEARDALVLVRIGARALVVFPDRETDLGAMAEGDRIATRKNALRREAFRVPA